jgi:hypothetical protein
MDKLDKSKVKIAKSCGNVGCGCGCCSSAFVIEAGQEL